MSLLQELRFRVYDSPRRPEVLTIRDDQAEQLARELNDLSFINVGISADSIRIYGCHVLGIPIRIES